MDLTPAERALLARRLPELDLAHVRVRQGLPRLLAWRRARAMAIPHLMRRGVTLHFRAPRSPELLLHEAYHALQVQRMGRARFTLAYLWHALRHGTGRGHPLEAPAYAFARR